MAKKKDGKTTDWTWKSVPKGCGIMTIRRRSDGMDYFLGVTDMRQRASDHYRLLQRGEHHCSGLQRAWTEAGPEAFEIKAIEVVPCEAYLAILKQLCIERAERCFNMKNAISARMRKWKRENGSS